MERKSSAKRSLFVKVFCLCAVFACIFALASCEIGSTTSHDCIYSSNQLNRSNFSNFRSQVESKSNTGTYYYYLGEKVTFTGTLKIPEGTYVGICLGKFELINSDGGALYEVIDTNGDGQVADGGIFTFVCGAHAYHGGNVYNYVDQNAIEMFGRSGDSIYGRHFKSNTEYCISLRSDLHISADYTSFVIPAGKILNVCTNGYNFTYDLDLESNGGRLAVFNCKDSNFHECLRLHKDALAITQNELSDMLTALDSAVPGDEIHLYLIGDVSWDGELVIPEGVTMVVCLNGHSMDGVIKKGTDASTVKNEETGEEVLVETTYGNAFVFDCSHHICTGICTTGEVLALNNNSIDWTVDMLKNYVADPESPTTVYCVLEDDVDVPVIEGINLFVCVNGFKNRDNEWITKTDGDETTVVGGIIYHNCVSSHTCEIACMIGFENKSILLDTADGVNLFLSQLGEEVDGTVLNMACFSLTADLKGTGEIYAPEDTLAVICLNGYSMGDVTVAEGTNVFVFECGKEYCSEMKNDVISFDQGVANLFAVYSYLTGDPYPFNANYIFALSEDIVIPENSIAVGEGFTVNFCTRGHSITGIDGVSGVTTHKGCTHRIPPHLCAVSDMLGENSEPIKAKSAATVSAALNGIEPGVHFYHLTENLTGSGTVTAPAGTVVGICLDGYSIGNVNAGSNVFFYECEKHYCDVLKANIPVFDQGVFDFFEFLIGDATFSMDYTSAIAISEDVNINVKFAVEGDNTFTICTCGHAVTCNSTTGNVIVHDDANYAFYNHACAIPYVLGVDVSSSPITIPTVSALNGIFAGFTEEFGGFYHLTSDLVGDGVITAPENCFIGICLNGFSLGDVEIDPDSLIFVYECGTHYCSLAQSEIPAFDQGVFDLLAALMSGEENPSFYIDSDTALALIGDVNIPFDITVAEGYTLYICTCGYDFTVSDGVTLTNVTTHDVCLPDESAITTYASESFGDCAVCGRRSAQPLNFTTLREMIDEDGNVTLPKGSYYYYLENDFQLTRTLKIPAGVDLHICLHGYTLYSAYLWSDITTYGCGFPESICSGVVIVDSGATFNIHDCSEKMTGNLTLKQFRLRSSDTGLLSMSFYVVESGSGEAESLEALFANLGSIAVNSGTINVYGGNMYAITGIINGTGGVLNIYNGNLYAMFVSVMCIDFANGSEATGSQVYIGEGATISSIYVGVYSMGGDVVLDGGTINSGMAGIMAVTENPSTDMSVAINGGEINVGSSDRLMASSMISWSAMGGEILDFAGASLDLGFDEFIGVATNGSLELNGDVNMVMGEMTTGTGSNGESKLTVEFQTMGNNPIKVSDKVQKKYTIIVDDSTNVGDNDVFVPLNNAIKMESVDGGIVIVPINSDEFVTYAGVTDMSVSTEGDIKLNIFTEIDPAFATSGRVRFCVEYDNEVYVYTLDDAILVNVDGVNKYMFSIHTAAKDYATSVNCYFYLEAAELEDGEEDPYEPYVNICIGSQRLSIENYLNVIISNRALNYDDATINLAKAMKNYCAAAAYHFGVAENYAVVEGMGSYLEQVTPDLLDEFKAVKGEAYDTAPVIYKTATVILKSETSIRIYFDLDDGYSLETDDNGNVFIVGMVDGSSVKIPLTVTNGEENVPIVVGNTGLSHRPYYLEIFGVYAKDYFDMYTVNVDGKSYMSYSVASYARTIIANKNNAYSEDVVDVAKSMIVYGYIANIYFNGEMGEGGTE